MAVEAASAAAITRRGPWLRDLSARSMLIFTAEVAAGAERGSGGWITEASRKREREGLRHRVMAFHHRAQRSQGETDGVGSGKRAASVSEKAAKRHKRRKGRPGMTAVVLSEFAGEVV